MTVPCWPCTCLPVQERRWPHPAKPLTLSQRVARPHVCGVSPRFCCVLTSGCVLCSIVTATADPHMSVPGLPRVPARGGPRKGTCRPLPQQAAAAPVLCVSMWRMMLEAEAWAPPPRPQTCYWPQAGSHPLWASFFACRTRRLDLVSDIEVTLMCSRSIQQTLVHLTMCNISAGGHCRTPKPHSRE